MSSKSTSKIITNRQLNFTLSPVDTHNSKTMPHQLQNYEIDGVWNNHQSIILDVIIDSLFRRAYKKHKKLPQSWRSQKVLDRITELGMNGINPNTVSFLSLPPREAYSKYVGSDVIAGLEEDYKYDVKAREHFTFEQYVDRVFEINREYQDFLKRMTAICDAFVKDMKLDFNYLELFNEYPFLNPYKYTLLDHLKRIESTKFKMNYKVKYIESRPVFDENGKLTERGRLIDLHYQMQNFQNIFEVEGDKRNFKLNFKTPLAKLIIYNTLIMDTDWFPTEACSLSKNGYFMFKRFVLNRVSGKYKANTISLKFDELKTYLDLRWSNDRGVHTLIAKALTDMTEKGIVGSFKEGRNLARERFYELNFNHNGAGDQGAED